MKITIVAGLFTERNVNIYTGQLLSYIYALHNRPLNLLLFRVAVMAKLRFFLSVWVLLISVDTQGQQWKAEWVWHDAPSAFKTKVKEVYKSEQSLSFDYNRLISSLHSKGYIEASIDSIRYGLFKQQIFLTGGILWTWDTLYVTGIGEEVLKQIKAGTKTYDNRPVAPAEIATISKRVLTWCENNGYPFAAISTESSSAENGKITAHLNLNKNSLIVYDTLFMKSKARIAKGYLYSYLNIKPGEVYDESVVVKINKRLKDLPFVTMKTDPKVFFVNNKAIIHLDLADKRNSQFDFLVGFLPNNNVTGRLLITGEANINLLSAFGRGENIRLSWKRLQEGTQNFDAGFRYPYIAKMPFGADASIQLYKRDTSFLNVQYKLGLQYLITGVNYLEAFVENKFTNILNLDTNQVITARRLPDFNDTRSTLLGVKGYFESLDYRLNPTKGFILSVSVAAGSRVIKKNRIITTINDPENPGETFEALYDTVNLKQLQVKAEYRIEKYWKLGKRSTIKTGLTGAGIFAERLFQNELFRVGGIKLLRGFDEEQLFTSLYNIATVELRYLISRNSYVYFFSDAGYLQFKLRDEIEHEAPVGFGVGMSFDTKAGIFAVSYAYGRLNNTPLDLRSAKIHFGYINYF